MPTDALCRMSGLVAAGRGGRPRPLSKGPLRQGALITQGGTLCPRVPWGLFSLRLVRDSGKVARPVPQGLALHSKASGHLPFPSCVLPQPEIMHLRPTGNLWMARGRQTGWIYLLKTRGLASSSMATSKSRVPRL